MTVDIPDTCKKILGILADGKFHSGTELATRLGISRSAIWKQLRVLPELGLEYLAVTGKGYRLTQAIELLDQSKIYSALNLEVAQRISSFKLFDQINSTNSFLMSEVGQSFDSGSICIAEHQTAGKGRRGREWVSSFGSNIYLSVLWHFSSGPSAISTLSLVMGVAVVRALSQFNIEGIGLKWPNDIYWQGKKLGGILVEVTGEADGPCTAVVGLGLNISLSEKVAKNISLDWVDLQEIMRGTKLSRNHLAATLINELINIIATYELVEFNTYLDEWRSYDCLMGEMATLYFGKRQFQGEVRGIDDQGMLLLKNSAGEIKAYASGEVSFSASR
jgi:BirA family biotin operon repressor/biotin-[acetyl-CoA-carboxylase] ligase